MKSVRFILLIVFSMMTLLSEAKTKKAAAAKQEGFTAYFAAGPNFIIPSSFRVGWDQWEFGMLGQTLIGANKVFRVPNGNTYCGFGVGGDVEAGSALGFQASVGWNYNLILGLGFRVEMLAFSAVNGRSLAHGLVGVSYGF